MNASGNIANRVVDEWLEANAIKIKPVNLKQLMLIARTILGTFILPTKIDIVGANKIKGIMVPTNDIKIEKRASLTSTENKALDAKVMATAASIIAELP